MHTTLERAIVIQHKHREALRQRVGTHGLLLRGFQGGQVARVVFLYAVFVGRRRSEESGECGEVIDFVGEMGGQRLGEGEDDRLEV